MVGEKIFFSTFLNSFGLSINQIDIGQINRRKTSVMMYI